MIDGEYFPNPKIKCYEQAPLIFDVFLDPFTMCIKKNINKRTVALATVIDFQTFLKYVLCILL